MSVYKQVCIGTEAWLYSVLMLDSDTTGPALTLDPILTWFGGCRKSAFSQLSQDPRRFWRTCEDVWVAIDPLYHFEPSRSNIARMNLSWWVDFCEFLWFFLEILFWVQCMLCVCWCEHLWYNIDANTCLNRSPGRGEVLHSKHTTLCMCLKTVVVRPISCEIPLVRSPNFVFSRLRRV